MPPVGTIGMHRWLRGWQPKSLGGRRQALPNAKALPLTMGPSGPHRTRPPKHTGAWQPGPMAVRTEGVGGPPASRRPCSLIPVLPAWGSHRSPAFAASQMRRVALSWLCQWSNCDVQAVPWRVWVSIVPSGHRSGWNLDTVTFFSVIFFFLVEEYLIFVESF